MIDRVGQRVQILSSPWNKGTVSQVTKGWFTVVFDWPEEIYSRLRNSGERRKGEPRGRYQYRSDQAVNFGPETHEEIVFLDDDSAEASDGTEHVEVGEALISAGLRAIMERD